MFTLFFFWSLTLSLSFFLSFFFDRTVEPLEKKLFFIRILPTKRERDKDSSPIYYFNKYFINLRFVTDRTREGKMFVDLFLFIDFYSRFFFYLLSSYINSILLNATQYLFFLISSCG